MHRFRHCIHLFVALTVWTTLGIFSQSAFADACDEPMTTMEMLSCQSSRYIEARAELNKKYEGLAGRLDSQGRSLLEDAHATWIKFRDAHCSLDSDVFRGGSMEQLQYVACLQTLTEERTGQLEAQCQKRSIWEPTVDSSEDGP